MYAVGRLSSYISQGVYTVSAPFHPFGGAVDIIVVEQPDGSFKSSPWYVKFGKFQGVLKTKEKIVNISINGVEAEFHMYLDHKGEAYFLREMEGEEIDSINFSPPSSGDEIDDHSRNGRMANSNDYEFSVKQPSFDSPINFDNGKIMVRTNSRRSRIFGLMFGQKSVKENKSHGGDVAMERVSSLESAEIAADLLDVKWSTNLSTDILRRGNTSKLSASDILSEEPVTDSQVNGDQSSPTPLVDNSMDIILDHSLVQEATVLYNEQMGNTSAPGIADTECSNGANNPNQCLNSKQRDGNTCMLRTSVLDDKFEVLSEASTGMHKLVFENATSDNIEEAEFVNSVPSVQDSPKSEPGVGPHAQYKLEVPFAERVRFSSPGAANEESEDLLVYCNASENSSVRVFSNGQGLETHLSQGECEEANVHAGDLVERAKVIPEMDSQHEHASRMNKDNPNNTKLRSDEDSDKLESTAATFLCELNSFSESTRNGVMNSYSNSFSESTRNGVMNSYSSFDKHLVSSESARAESLENIHAKIISERHSEVMNETQLVESFETQLKENSSSHPCMSGSVEVSLEKPSKAHGSCTQVVNDNVVHLVEEADSQGIYMSSRCSNSNSLDQEEHDVGDEDDIDYLHNALSFVDKPQGSSTDNLSRKTSHLSNLLLTSEEDQFLFSDIDNFIPSGMQCKDSAFLDTLETENDSLVTVNDMEDLHQSSNMDHRSHLSPVKLIQEYSHNAFEALLEESTSKSSPMSIPGSRKFADEEVDWRIESLPNFRSHIDKLESLPILSHIDKLEVCDVPLSHSLDSHSEKLRQKLLRKDVSSSSTTNVDNRYQLAQNDLTMKDARIWEEFRNMSTKSTIEISLCKHMLYEGMGADAASQAFDAEKIDPDKCASLGPQLLKNNNLIVKIGGRYFPWDAAEPYISERISSGHDQIVEPEGMIDVDRVKKNIDGEPSGISSDSGGSWTLWPFRRARTTNPVRPGPDGTDDSVVVNASDSYNDATGNTNSRIVKADRKKVKSIVPPSEQLATLNLKEGRNVVTFTFSTAMLGKQQVDARIYLWKWNTRIVVSDVDGTITRSDVLGQFMPLVGKDWSHIGVTHLFSAIKENGYQLLFLSARAISQAHLTRQFLFNLKQDGKALPDGPVVISPDGLFPSLFREVIRRAPHEFKIACLQDIRALFPPDCNPFYAGFGNRITDEISYRKLGIPKGKIFIINARGEVAVNRRFDRKSYTSLHALVDDMFPPKTSAGQEDFNSWNFWRMPLPDINS